MMPAIPLTVGEFALVSRSGHGYHQQTVEMEPAMLAIAILAAFLVVIATLNIVDFGRID